MLDPLNISLADYGISPRQGFLPEDLPLMELSDPYYRPWELITHNLPLLLQRGVLRQRVDKLPVLSLSYLKTESEWRRAYLLLSFMTHAYIWGGEQPLEVSLSKQICRQEN